MDLNINDLVSLNYNHNWIGRVVEIYSSQPGCYVQNLNNDLIFYQNKEELIKLPDCSLIKLLYTL